jgi:Ca-activated chloride channel family protein
MAANISLKPTWNHDPLPATEQTSLAYLLVDVTQPDAPVQPTVPVENQALNLNFVLDTSGSMAGAKLDNLKKAVAWVIDHLGAQDTLSITLFDDEVHPLVPATRVEDRAALQARIAPIREAGGTAMSKGLTVGLQEARNSPAPGAVSRIVVLTDGQTWGDADLCVELARQAGDAGIPITCLGVGADEDWSIELLDAIARESGGEVGYIEQPEEIEGAFESTLRRMQSTLARNLRVTFTPAAGISARAVYRVSPLISRLWPALDDVPPTEGVASAQAQTGGSATSLSLPLGDLQSADGQTLLFEIVLPPRRPGSYRLARLLLEYETGDPSSPKGDTALDLVASFSSTPVTGPGNARVMNSVEKATTFKLQTRALQASMAGDNAAATRNLRAAATRLLNMGETELAQATEREAERIESEGHMSPAATKKLTFDTRKLAVSETVHLKEE